MGIKRPVRFRMTTPEAGHGCDHLEAYMGEQWESTEQEHAAELEACVNLMPRAIALLRRLEEIVSDAEYDLDPHFGEGAKTLNAERIALLAEWDAALKEGSNSTSEKSDYIKNWNPLPRKFNV